MSTPTPRWTAETEAVVAAGIHRGSKQCVFDLDECLTEGQHRWEAREVLTALADAGVLTAVGGETRTIWRTRNLTTGGSSVHWTRESADAAMAVRSLPRVPWDPPPDPYVLETAEQTTYPDGTVITSPWREVTDDPA